MALALQSQVVALWYSVFMCFIQF